MAGIVVEDGTGLADANSYASENTADTYFDDRADTDWSSSSNDAEAALIRATQALDILYRSKYPGTRVNGRSQGLEWPRQDATDINGYTIAETEVPIEVIEATCELAKRERITPGSAMPDLERAVKSVKAGSVSVDFAANAREDTLYQIVDGIMSNLVGGGPGSFRLWGEISRG